LIPMRMLKAQTSFARRARRWCIATRTTGGRRNYGG